MLAKTNLIISLATLAAIILLWSEKAGYSPAHAETETVNKQNEQELPAQPKLIYPQVNPELIAEFLKASSEFSRQYLQSWQNNRVQPKLSNLKQCDQAISLIAENLDNYDNTEIPLYYRKAYKIIDGKFNIVSDPQRPYKRYENGVYIDYPGISTSREIVDLFNVLELKQKLLLESGNTTEPYNLIENKERELIIKALLRLQVEALTIKLDYAKNRLKYDFPHLPGSLTDGSSLVDELNRDSDKDSKEMLLKFKEDQKSAK